MTCAIKEIAMGGKRDRVKEGKEAGESLEKERKGGEICPFRQVLTFQLFKVKFVKRLKLQVKMDLPGPCAGFG